MKIFQFKRVFEKFSGKEQADFLVDDSHILKREPGRAIHFFYAILFGLGITAALWQHGSPVFTLLCLGLLFPMAGILFIPYRFADILLRRMLACGIFFGACFWMTYRISKGIAFDLVLVEGMILSSFAFLVNGTGKDCHYLFFISLFLLIYAGLIPRKLLLYLVPGSALVLVLISLAEREQHLAPSSRLLKADSFSVFRNFKRSWHLLLLQFLIALPIFAFVLSFIPLQESADNGLFEVSFATSRNSALPPDLKKWLRQDRQIAPNPEGDFSFTGKNPDSAGKTGEKTDIPDAEAELDGNGRGAPPGKDLLFTVSMPVKLYHLATLYDMYDGKKWQLSSSLAKRKLLSPKRRIPAKYFAVESTYSMQKWISSSLYAPFRPAGYSAVGDTGQVAQWYKFFRKLKINSFSARFDHAMVPALPFEYKVTSQIRIPYLPVLQQKEKKDPEIGLDFKEYLSVWTTLEKARLEKLRLAEEARQKRLAAAREKQRKLAAQREKMRRLAAEKARKERLAKAGKNNRPGRKKVVKKTVRPPVKTVRKPAVPPQTVKKNIRKAVRPSPRPVYDPYWLEPLPKSHFLKLPDKLSPKIAALGDRIAKNHLLPYEKAIALRDHLRKNYTYRLYAAPTPAGRESVEYFLFDVKEGHCEYFAAALAVLARTQNLPSRVAVGFSPGNYNALTQKFEVFEYHAHAWTQIFIEKVGWLTFDAVPPSEIPSVTSPIGIGHFRDPFGDEWKIMPPELTGKTLEFVKKIHDKELAERRARQLERQKKALKKSPQTDKGKKEIKKLPPAKKRPEAGKIKPVSAGERIRENLALFKEKIYTAFQYLLLTGSGRSIGIAFLAGGVLLVLFFRKICRWSAKICCRFKLGLAARELKRGRACSPEQKVLLLYRMTRLLLQVVNMTRKNNRELLAYAGEAAHIYRRRYCKKYPEHQDQEEKSQKFYLAVSAVFSLYYALEYGGCTIGENQCDLCLEHVKSIYALLSEICPGGFFFMEKRLFGQLF